MSTRWLLAAIHLLGLGIGLGSVWARARALRGQLDSAGVRQVLSADTWWAVAAAVWISTGLLRAFGGFEKGSSYYLNNHLFLTKMGLLVLVIVLEIGPIMEFTRWRRALGRRSAPDTAQAGRFAWISLIQAFLVILMLIAATGMARGFGSVTT